MKLASGLIGMSYLQNGTKVKKQVYFIFKYILSMSSDIHLYQGQESVIYKEERSGAYLRPVQV